MVRVVCIREGLEVGGNINVIMLSIFLYWTQIFNRVIFFFFYWVGVMEGGSRKIRIFMRVFLFLRWGEGWIFGREVWEGDLRREALVWGL